MLSQRLFLRWGSGENDHSAVVAPPVAVQRGTASNLVSALHAACPKLELGALFQQVARFVRTFWYHVAADSASANERVRAEVELALAPYPNAILLWCACFAHLAAFEPVVLFVQALVPTGPYRYMMGWHDIVCCSEAPSDPMQLPIRCQDA